MSKVNKLNGMVSKLNQLPAILRSKALTLFFGKVVPFTGTAGTCVEELTEVRCTISVKNRKRVQNHIGSVHAVAAALLAETATGLIIGMNVPDDRIPVIKSMKADYVKRAKGDMKATAALSREQVALIRTTEKGETRVPVAVTDEEGKEPVIFEMIWAWTPKKR